MANQKIVVIGGVAAGGSFAARARRLSEKVQITMIERGADVSFANCGMPYFIGNEIPDRRALSVQTPNSLKLLLNLNVKTKCEALRIDRANKRVLVRGVENDQEEWLDYDKLMLAPGATPAIPDVPGVDDERILVLRDLRDMDRIAQASKAGMKAVVIGAGFIGLEMAEQLHRKGLNIDLVQIRDQVLPIIDKKFANMLEGELKDNGINLHLSEEVTRFENNENAVLCHLSSGKVLQADLVIMSIGVKPESQLARDAGLELGKNGHITVNHFMQTSDPDIYAAGDVVETEERLKGDKIALPLGGPANRQGRVAADHIFLGEKARPYPGSLGTAIVRVFKLAAGTTGWNEKRLQEAGINYGSATVRDSHHASYYPGAKPLNLKIFWEKETGILLGAQAIGEEGVDKRLDILATAITAKMNIEDLCHLEFSYAPPFGSAKDVVNLAGFAATNMEDGLVDVIHDLPEYDPGVQIVDVRGKPLADASPVPGAINIPLPALRNSLDKLDPNKPVITVCVIGKGSYFASRILSQNGFKVKSLAGGVSVNQAIIAGGC